MTKNFFRILFCLGLLYSFTIQTTFAQKTSDELQAEREQLTSELKSKKVQERKDKLANLKAPGAVGLESVDGLAVSATKLLVGTTKLNETVPEMYKRTIGETVDGVTNVTVEKPTLEELTALAGEIAIIISGVTDAQNSVKKVTDDVKSISPLKAKNALKSLNYSKDVLSLTLPELQLNAKIVANLIETLKTSGNY
ncbi:MAG: hypothetical protein MdMp024_0128 [Bacteroidales bacterium]